MTANGVRQRSFLAFTCLLLFATGFSLMAWGCGSSGGSGSEDGMGEMVNPDQVLRELPIDRWDKPEFVLLITGEQHGYLEPCGCTERQKGGVARRHALVKEVTGRDWPLVGLDLGGLGGNRMGQQAEIKLNTAIEALRMLGYQALGVGPEEVQFGPLQLFALFSADAAQAPTMVSANLRFFDAEADEPARLAVVEQGTRKIGVTSVYGKREHLEASNNEIHWRDPQEVLGGVVEQLAEVDLRVLLAHTSREEAEALLKQFPGFDLAVCTGGGDAGNDQPMQVGDTMLVQVGHKGMNVGLVGFFGETEPKLRYALITLNERWGETPEVKELLDRYQQELREQQVILRLFGQEEEGGGVSDSLPLARAHPDGEFVGAEKCGSCHTKAFFKWKQSGHAKAFEDLEKVKHAYDPECVTCHTTGWQQQEVLPWKSGFRSKELTPHLVGNGCENCHGPGSLHVAAEQGGDAELQKKWRETMRIDQAWAKENLCSVKCHDLDNSPKFLFPKYWEKIAHPGKN